MSQFFYNQRENLVNDAIGVSLEIGNFCTLSALFNQSWFVRVDFASVAIAFKLSLLQYRI